MAMSEMRYPYSTCDAKPTPAMRSLRLRCEAPASTPKRYPPGVLRTSGDGPRGCRSGGFCCQVPPDPALRCYPEGLVLRSSGRLRGNRNLSFIVVVGNY